MLLAICKKKLAIFASTGNYFRPWAQPDRSALTRNILKILVPSKGLSRSGISQILQQPITVATATKLWATTRLAYAISPKNENYDNAW